METTTKERNVLRVNSHRARAKLQRITSEIEWYFSFTDGNNFAEVGSEYVEQALAITGITRARPKETLSKCWAR